ncbi:hypothetical protein [Xanthomonas sp. D-109]|uniref:hypothetical protein n=1 Tax=Xanthomonas sp. D-109 TaxID=2821274 RepID=UPI001ADD059C|nr:hypothetical protein [Xanthomonas sp. D-109]MBO9881859.1 hypothetical protein [Xanthomonas sp. D-109]
MLTHCTPRASPLLDWRLRRRTRYDVRHAGAAAWGDAHAAIGEDNPKDPENTADTDAGFCPNFPR